MFRSIRLRCQLIALVACVALATSLEAQILKFDVFPAYAPNGRSESTSPSWPPYVTNAIAGIHAGGVPIGDRDVTPTAYELIHGPISPLEMIYTPDFNSWRGTANPTLAFSGEFGNNVHFGVCIVADVTSPFALNQLEWALESDDDDQYFDQAGTFANANYSSTRVGRNYGPDKRPETADDLIYKNGESGALEIHELSYVGIGDGFKVEDTAPFTDQQNIDNLLRTILTGCGNCDVKLTGTYRLNDPDLPTPIIASGKALIQIEHGFGGDLNRNGDIECDDADILTSAIVANNYDILNDVTGDGKVNFADLDYFVHDISETGFGDVNCDGFFNTKDLIHMFTVGKYEDGRPALFSEGDATADGFFTTSDLVLMFQDGYYNPLTLATSSVPEPSSVVLVLIGSLVLFRVRNRS